MCRTQNKTRLKGELGSRDNNYSLFITKMILSTGGNKSIGVIGVRRGRVYGDALCVIPLRPGVAGGTSFKGRYERIRSIKLPGPTQDNQDHLEPTDEQYPGLIMWYIDM